MQPVDVQYFAASTLAAKVAHQWDTLDGAHAATQLRQTILAALTGGFVMAARPVRLRLYVALAGIVFRSGASQWPDSIADVVCIFATAASRSHMAPQMQQGLLEFLQVVAEEWSGYRGASEQMLQLRVMLEQAFPMHVNRLVCNTLADRSAVTLHAAAVSCLRSWIQSDLAQAEVLLPVDAPSAADAPTAFTLLCQCTHHADADVREAAWDALAALCELPALRRRPNALRRTVIPAVLEIVQAEIGRSAPKWDSAAALGPCKATMALAETCDRHLTTWARVDGGVAPALRAAAAEQAIAVARLVLLFAAFPGWYPVDETLSPLALSLWTPLRDEILSGEPDAVQLCRQTFAPVFEQLLYVVLAKTTRPSPDVWEHQWTSDDRRAFIDYGVEMREALLPVQAVLGARCTRLLVEALQRADANQYWPAIEAVLLAIRAVADDGVQATAEDAAVVVHYAGIYACGERPELQRAALGCIGSYAVWLGERKTLLVNALRLLLECLSDRSSARASAAVGPFCDLWYVGMDGGGGGGAHIGEPMAAMMATCGLLYRHPALFMHAAVFTAMCKPARGGP